MKKNKNDMLNKMRNINYTLYVSSILIILMCTGCEGWKELYLINCSSDVAIIQLTPAFIPTDSIDRIYPKKFYQEEFNNTESNFLFNGDSITIELKPGESLRIALTMWIFYPGKIRGPSLSIDNLGIITKSDTCIARNRKEILQLQKDKRFKYDNHYKGKIGQNTRQNRKILIK